MSRGLGRFVREDFKAMKDTKHYFTKISSELDSALLKNAGVSRSRPADVDDASNLLTATQSCFRYTALGYIYQVNNH